MHSIIWKRLRPMRWREKRFLNFSRGQSSSIRPAGKFAYIKSKRWGIFEKYWPSLWTPYCIIHQIAGFGGREVAMFFIAEHVGVREGSWVRYKPFCYDVIVRRPTCPPPPSCKTLCFLIFFYYEQVTNAIARPVRIIRQQEVLSPIHTKVKNV